MAGWSWSSRWWNSCNLARSNCTSCNLAGSNHTSCNLARSNAPILLYQWLLIYNQCHLIQWWLNGECSNCSWLLSITRDISCFVLWGAHYLLWSQANTLEGWYRYPGSPWFKCTCPFNVTCLSLSWFMIVKIFHCCKPSPIATSAQQPQLCSKSLRVIAKCIVSFCTSNTSVYAYTQIRMILKQEGLLLELMTWWFESLKRRPATSIFGDQVSTDFWILK
jgi:hypothetical protein